MYHTKDLHLDYIHLCPHSDQETTFRIFYSYEPASEDQLEFWGAPCILYHPASFHISYVLTYCTVADRWYPVEHSPIQEETFQQFILENHHESC